MADETTQLVQATWGLLAATVLLVIAGFIPPAQAAIQRMNQRKRAAAEVVPDLHIFLSRVNGTVEKCAGGAFVTTARVPALVSRVGKDLELVAAIIERAPGLGMLFANEVYLLRHLLTRALIPLEKVALRIGKGEAISAPELTELEQLVWRQYLAVKATIIQAEAGIPSWARTIRGEAFWDRFHRLSAERELDADKQIVETRHGRK